MNIINNSYLHYTFQTALQIEVDTTHNRTLQGTFVYISRIIHNWITIKFPSLNLPSQPGTFQKDQFTQSVNTIYSYDNLFFCIKTSHTDATKANRIWITEAELSVTNDVLSLAVRNAYTSNSPKNDEDYKTYSVPNFIKDISQKVNLTDAFCKTGQITTVENQSSLDQLYKLITHSNRLLPVIIISENTSLDKDSSIYFTVDNGYLLDGASLANNLSFISHVFYLPSQFQKKWTELIGDNWGVYNGAVRTYYPKFDAEDSSYYNHPILVPGKILAMNYSNDDGKEYWGGVAFSHKLTHTIKNYNMHSRFNWNELGYKFFNQAHREALSQRNSSSQNTLEWCKLLESENTNLNEQIEELKTLLSVQDTELEQAEELKRKYISINTTNQNRIHHLESILAQLQSEPQGKEYPSKYSDIPHWIQENFSGRIELLPKAIRSLKNAVYNDIALVCKIIECLGTTYYNMKMNFVNQSDYESILTEFGVEDTPAISDISAGEQGDEYYPMYNGKKHKLERHITKGQSRDPRECLRIYYFWDDESCQVVIGSLPGHLRIRSSN